MKRDPIQIATDAACGVGNKNGLRVITGRERDLIELGLRRMEAAGYRILAPEELDSETLEAAAKVADDLKLRDHPKLSPGSEMNAWWSGQSIGHEDVAMAVRNLRSVT